MHCVVYGRFRQRHGQRLCGRERCTLRLHLRRLWKPQLRTHWRAMRFVTKGWAKVLHDMRDFKVGWSAREIRFSL